MPPTHERLCFTARRPTVPAPAALSTRCGDFESGMRPSCHRHLSRTGVSADANYGLRWALEGNRTGLGGVPVVSNAWHPRWSYCGSPARFRAISSMAAT
jgi:hypothetical protein